MEVRNPDGSDSTVSLLGMPAESDWVLYAPYSDKSLMRNILAYQLGRDLGHYAPRTKLCEVVLKRRLPRRLRAHRKDQARQEPSRRRSLKGRTRSAVTI